MMSSSSSSSSSRKKIDDSTTTFDPPPEYEEATYAISELAQYCVLVRRFAYIFLVDEDQFPEVLIPGCVSVLVNGLSFQNFGVNDYIAGAVLYNMIAHGMIVSNGIVLNVPSERALIIREYSNGTYSIKSYWTARCTVSALTAVFLGVPMLAIWYPIVGLSGKITSVFLVWLGSTLNAVIFTLIASVVGLVQKTPLASGQVFTPVGDAMTIFAGLLIIKRFIKPYAYPLYYGMPISYAFEVACTGALEHKGDDGHDVLAYYDLHPENRPLDYVILTIMILFWFTLGYAVSLNKLSAGN